MAEKSGFFNALLIDGVHDRKYNADDYCDNLATILNNGVLRETNNLKVTATGMTVKVNAGRGWIKGHYYYNDSEYTFDATTPSVSGQRYDRVMLRLNTDVNARNISLVYVEGTASSNPTKPAPTRSGNIYDLVLADIYVNTNATSLTITDTRSDVTLCGWLYSPAEVSGDITNLQTQVAQILGSNRFAYNCTGTDDNISLSEIAQAIYTGSYTVGSLSSAAEAFLSAIGGNTYLGALSSEAQISIDVVGRIGVTRAYSGTGASSSRYRWFDIGLSELSTKKLVFDFAKCEKINVSGASATKSIIFYGADLDIRNANVYATGGATCEIQMTDASVRNGYVNFENCRLVIDTSLRAVIADNGTFTNCYCYVKATNAFCFEPVAAGLIVLNGGTYYAYAEIASLSAIIKIDNSSTAVVVGHNINAPVVAVTNFTQGYLAKVSSDGNIYINGIVTTLTNLTTGTPNVNVTGKIELSKR